MTTTENAIAALKTDLQGLNTQIIEIKLRHKTELEGLLQQRTPLARAIHALSGESRTMSAESRAAIKAGLARSRAAKLAGTNGAPAVPAPAPTSPGPAKTAPEAPAPPAKKEPQRAH